MKLTRIFKEGRVINEKLYAQLQDLDRNKVSDFFGCGNEFRQNRDWWIMEIEGKIVAYCGCIYTEGICIFNRAWVHPNYRGKGIQKRLIQARLKAGKLNSHTVVTYVTMDNPASANSLIKKGFKIFIPSYQYAGSDKIYFRYEF